MNKKVQVITAMLEMVTKNRTVTCDRQNSGTWQWQNEILLSVNVSIITFHPKDTLLKIKVTLSTNILIVIVATSIVWYYL